MSREELREIIRCSLLDEFDIYEIMADVDKYADQEIAVKDKEIERLKGLIEKTFTQIYEMTYRKEAIEAKWQTFKQENQL